MDAEEILRVGFLKENGVAQTPEFRVSFPFVFQPRKSKKPGQEPKFMVSMLFPKTANLAILQQLVLDLVIEKYGQDKTKWPKFKQPFRDQGEKAQEYKGYEPGNIFIIPTSKSQPGVVDANVHRIINPLEFYSGCYAVATVRAFFYEGETKGFAFGLMNIQKTREGDPLGNRVSAEQDFKPIGGTPAPAGAVSGASMADMFR